MIMQYKLMNLRRSKGLNQKELADLLSISIKAYANKELGKNEFTMNEMFTLSLLFNETIENIFLPTLLQNGVKKKGK